MRGLRLFGIQALQLLSIVFVLGCVFVLVNFGLFSLFSVVFYLLFLLVLFSVFANYRMFGGVFSAILSFISILAFQPAMFLPAMVLLMFSVSRSLYVVYLYYYAKEAERRREEVGEKQKASVGRVGEREEAGRSEVQRINLLSRLNSWVVVFGFFLGLVGYFCSRFVGDLFFVPLIVLPFAGVLV